MAADGGQWIGGRPSFLFPVRALATVFRAEYLAGLAQAFDAGQLTFAGGTSPLADRGTFTGFLGRLRAVPWVVYAKRPFAGPAQVLEYLGRDTHRVALSNNRLVDHAEGRVRFRWRDYADHDRVKVMTLEAAASSAASSCTWRHAASCASATSACSPIARDATRCRGVERSWASPRLRRHRPSPSPTFCNGSSASTSRAVRCAARAGCKSRHSRKLGRRRTPHDGQPVSRANAGPLRTRVRSAGLCLAPVDDPHFHQDPGPGPWPAPLPRASRHGTHLSRTNNAPTSRIASRPTRHTIPIRCAVPSHAASSNRVYPHGTGAAAHPTRVAVRIKPYSLGRQQNESSTTTRCAWAGLFGLEWA